MNATVSESVTLMRDGNQIVALLGQTCRRIWVDLWTPRPTGQVSIRCARLELIRSPHAAVLIAAFRCDAFADELRIVPGSRFSLGHDASNHPEYELKATQA